MSAEVKWRVSTIEGVFEADLDTLKQWIHEGCVLPTDKVSKGSLNWIEAGRAPMLRATFNGEVPVPSALVPEANPLEATLPPLPDQSSHNDPDQFAQPEQPAAVAVTRATTTSSNVCYQHPERATKHICRACATPFCEECPKFVGTSKIVICPLCGELCSLFEQQRIRLSIRHFRALALALKTSGGHFVIRCSIKLPCYLARVSTVSASSRDSADASLRQSLCLAASRT